MYFVMHIRLREMHRGTINMKYTGLAVLISHGATQSKCMTMLWYTPCSGWLWVCGASWKQVEVRP